MNYNTNKKKREYNKEYYQNNKERLKKNRREYVQKNKHKIRDWKRKYYQRNREKLNKQRNEERRNAPQEQKERRRAYDKEYSRKWRKNNIERKRKYERERTENNSRIRLNHSLRVAIWYSIQENKAGRHWEDLVGYTLRDLMDRLSINFQKGMTWENYGEWHIDHKKAKSKFNFETPDDPEFKICWSLANLQPLWAEDNWRKNNK